MIFYMNVISLLKPCHVIGFWPIEIDHLALNTLSTEVTLSALKYCIMFVTGLNYIQIHERPIKNMTIGGLYSYQ